MAGPGPSPCWCNAGGAEEVVPDWGLLWRARAQPGALHWQLDQGVGLPRTKNILLDKKYLQVKENLSDPGAGVWARRVSVSSLDTENLEQTNVKHKQYSHTLPP